MTKITHKIQVNTMDAVYTVNATLRRIDERLVDHGERVAFIACKLCEAGAIDLDYKALFALCAFHDIGAYKTDEMDKMLEFETKHVWNHSIYGYLFLKYLTPLKEYAKAVLYHHAPWSEISDKDIPYNKYAAMLHLADRIDIGLTYNMDKSQFEDYIFNSDGIFYKEYSDIAHKCMQDNNFLTQLTDGTYHDINLKRCATFEESSKEALDYLKMIVYAIDFRSEHTVTHTINTVSIAVNIAKHFNLTDPEINDIALGALLHDVGKISIPVEILESNGRLSDEEMAIMRTHVTETESLIKGLVPDSVCDIAIRHHEKLDGKGYPYQISGDNLSFPQRIVAVADIVSALSTRRSYKEPFPKEKTLAILTDMSQTQLDDAICDYVISNYDSIIHDTEEERLNVIEQYQSITKEYHEIKETMAI